MLGLETTSALLEQARQLIEAGQLEQAFDLLHDAAVGLEDIITASVAEGTTVFDDGALYQDPFALKQAA